jgi:anaerobic dimethyl sulfoxide reductase subunit C (anchor subunit)
MSAGAFWVLGIVHFYASRKAGIEEADRMSDRALLAVVPVLALGMLASFLHLGSPLISYKAVTNFGSSWLSREVLFGVLFVVFGAVFAFLQWRKIGSFSIRNVIAWIAALLGVGLVYSMANVYLLDNQPAWNTLVTPISFFVTTLLLGALAMGAAYVWNYARVVKTNPECADIQCELMRSTLRWIAIAAVVLLGIELVIQPLYLAFLGTGGSAAITSLAMLYSDYSVVYALRLILVFVGAGVFGAFLYRNSASPGREKVLGNMAYTAFALVLVAEVLGRYLFYATQQGVGL